MHNHGELWIGLFLATATENAPGDFDDAPFAAVNAIGTAISADDFIARVRDRLESMGLRLDDVEDVEPLASRLRKCELHESLMRVIAPAQTTGVVQFGTFHLTSDDGPE